MATKPTTPAPDPGTDDLKMTPEEFAELRAEANRITAQDFHLGRFLQLLVHHLGHAHGLDEADEESEA
jgi:hypothetical protein